MTQDKGFLTTVRVSVQRFNQGLGGFRAVNRVRRLTSALWPSGRSRGHAVSGGDHWFIGIKCRQKTQKEPQESLFEVCFSFGRTCTTNLDTIWLWLLEVDFKS